MDLFELTQGEQDHIFVHGDAELLCELACNFLGCELAITSAPHKRRGLTKAVGPIPHFVVHQDLISQFVNNQAIRAETRKLRMGRSLHRFSSYEIAGQRRAFSVLNALSQ
jgi:hypothetical protein